MIHGLTDYLARSLTPYHATQEAISILSNNGFVVLDETEDWDLQVGGKYVVVRGGSSFIAFTIGNLDRFCYKIVAAHTDSPCLKLKENPVKKDGAYATLNVETYGGFNWQTFLDRPLQIAGRVVKDVNGKLVQETVTSSFKVTIPTLAIHQNRDVNNGATLNPQVDLLPLYALDSEEIATERLLQKIGGDGVVSFDLSLVNADMPYTFGVNDEFIASPRIDNLTSVYAGIYSLLSRPQSQGVCVVACLDHEEVGSRSPQGADGEFVPTVLKRIAACLRFDESEYYKALASSFLVSADNAHAMHPNHPEKCDPTNKTLLGGGIAIKQHCSKMYITEGVSSAVLKKIFAKAGVKYQNFFNRSDMKSGSTLGWYLQRTLGTIGADIGIAQLAMHSACECFAKADFDALVGGLEGFFNSEIVYGKDGVTVE